jgi:hypothetical protein
MKDYYIGIDVGIKGAMAIISTKEKTIEIFNLPTLGSTLSPLDLNNLLSNYSKDPNQILITIEKQGLWAKGGKRQGIKGDMTIMTNYGIALSNTIIHAPLHHKTPHPTTWLAWFKKPSKNKRIDKALGVAREHGFEVVGEVGRHDEGDAILIAFYGFELDKLES